MTCQRCHGLVVLNHAEVKCLSCGWYHNPQVWFERPRTTCYDCDRAPLTGEMYCLVHKRKHAANRERNRERRRRLAQVYNAKRRRARAS